MHFKLIWIVQFWIIKIKDTLVFMIYSDGNKFSDTLKILPKLKYYHEIFVKKVFFVFQKVHLH